jgi:NitT/TauT family transport system substrate-binding protein
MQLKRSIFSLLLFGALAVILAACASPQTPAQSAPSSGPLKIAVLPVLDALPMYVAQKEALFEKYGVTVEFIPVASAPERDQLIVAGQADGMVNEALSTALYNKDKVQVQTVRYARAASSEAALFSILASGKSGLKTAADLKGVPVGISDGTVIAYLTDRLLQAEGFAPDEIATVAVPKIPDRVNLLGTGELQAGMLPEPATSLALQNGAVLILDDTRHPEYSFSTLTFRKAVIDERPEAIRGFLAAVEEATRNINADPQKYIDVLLEQKVLPPPIAGTFTVPKFVAAGVPTADQWADMLAWAREKGLLDRDVPYADSVNASFLPR